MKKRSLVSLIVSCAVLATGSLSVYAQSQRYPTNVEIQRIIREFQQRASSPAYSRECCGGTEADTRTAAQRQPLESFVKVWSRVDLTVAPFLGWWVNNDGYIGVYPSNVMGRVCVIDASPGPSYKFSIGSIDKQHIRLTGELAGRVLINQKNPSGNVFLLVAFVDRDNVARAKPGSDIYTSPLLPQDPTKLGKANPQENSKIVREFKAAGCTASIR
ncbi:hypothetical protein [Kamptonema sp. UHCC 0994]|uniref:hypothetical protein n=1 Tax=Kamptonema sp. UHCC 0994 TaxID=3031329 RepID=UPI0023BA6871|nr:hypothetical protein [Kamptonema sp. UHCC 0994]MDF0556547.1 hypothetical protein [Kamptonema sp. UHCC 0994]